MTAVAFGARLDIEAASGPGENPPLRIRWRLRNVGGVDLGVFARLPDADPARSYAPELFYIDVVADVLHLRKMVLPVPPGLQMAERQPPGVVILRVGAEEQGSLTLAQPVPVWNPYRHAVMVGEARGKPVAPTLPRRVTELAVSFGLFNLLPEEKVFPLSPDRPEVVRLWPPGASMQRQVVLTDHIALPQPVVAFDYETQPPPRRR
ncbi:hypothetical protein GXW78_21075 [Roseomonas terrae]|uniref:Uncharacterized protein n=1 Tax=Neoroseomonas terrae TaxID=424799 RepID=A0ABS5EMA5_9PROT|nr:hypothetical protein [Neoroseomonas terrae]MBR0652161.1 hypothetical protein [Neoroseomonas terrae]